MPTINTDGIDDLADWYVEGQESWKIAATLLGGTRAIRAEAETYLPKFTLETDQAYERRRQQAVLKNFYRIMAKQMVGFIFADQVQITDSALPEEFLKDVDRRGSDVHHFARAFALNFLTKGLAHVLVDMPKKPSNARTLADDKRLGLRPFWVPFSPETVFNALADSVNGVERLMEVRWFEGARRQEGFRIEAVERIRVIRRRADGEIPLEPGAAAVEWILFEKKVEKANGGKDGAVIETWVEIDRGPYSIDEAPLITFYAERRGFMRSLSPMEDIAYLNVEHFQSSSDQRNILTVSRYPMQYQIGTETPVLSSGPYSVLHAKGNNKDVQPVEFGYIEPQGTGIQAGERDLDRILQEAQALGMQLLVRAPNPTATGQGIEFAQDTSPLQDAAQAIEDGLNQLLRVTAKFLNIAPENAGCAVVNKDFGISADTAKRIDALIKMRASGDISRDTFWQEMREIGVLRTGFDEEEEKVRLDKEDEAALERMTPPTPRQPADDDEDEREAA